MDRDENTVSLFVGVARCGKTNETRRLTWSVQTFCLGTILNVILLFVIYSQSFIAKYHSEEVDDFPSTL